MAKVRFKAMGMEWQTEVPAGTSLLQAAEKAGAPEGSACGGVCACSTCHVYVRQGAEVLTEAEEDEEDILDKAFDVQLQSRLGCQSKILDPNADLEIEITRESLDAYYNEHPNVADPRKRSA